MAPQTPTSPNDLILFTYPSSPYGRHITWYLRLRNIPFSTCTQPQILPRPILESLGIHYRQIPLLAIGRDIYADTRLILSKLESRHPRGRLSTDRPEHAALVKLMDSWLQNGLFYQATRQIPAHSPVINDPAFTKDRLALAGRKWDRETQMAEREASLTQIRDALAFVEGVLLQDGRMWVLETPGPTVADVKLMFIFDWLREFGGYVEGYHAGAYPRLFAWMDRFHRRVEKSEVRPTEISGDEAVREILKREFAEQGGRVDDEDPTGLVMGERVTVHTSFSKWHDSGVLVDLTPDEVTVGIRTVVKPDEKLHLHYPRVGTSVYRGERKEGKL